MDEPNAATSFCLVDDLIRQIDSLWESGQKPDPDALLNAAGLLPADVAKVLATDQWHRWHAGERLAAEDYFARHPAVGADREAALVLVYGEFLVREERGEKPSPGEYLARFPQCAAGLGRQLDFHVAVEEASPTPRVVSASPARGDGRQMDTDRNLLFGVLALQADIIDADRFAEACSAWAVKKVVPLADLLHERGWITTEERAHVEFLLERKLRKHHGDVHASLAAAADNRARGLMAEADDFEVRRSIAELPGLDSHTPSSTAAYEPENRERYTLTRLHAQGGLGQVWLALDGDLNRQVALKELRPERGGDPTLAARFLEEAKVTGQLEHPGIVPVYELARRSVDGQPFYTMRFIRGRTLAEAACDYHRKRAANEAGPLDLAALLNAFVAVCNAVAYAHSRGVIHRDLKPQNVVLGDFGEVIVLDWGLAKLVDRPEDATDLPSLALGAVEDHPATMPGQVLGTPSYMPPEQAEGAAVNHLSDVYGLGAILYEILTGRPPFEGSDTLEVLRRVVVEPPVRPRDVVPATPRALEAICLKALAKAPADRYGTAAELAEEVRRFLADEPVRAYREPAAARAGRWMRRHKTLVSGAAILLLTITAATAVGLLVLGRKNREIADQRNAALVAANEVEAVNAFLTEDLLGQADPDANARDKKVTVEELLKKAAGKVDGNPKLAGRPEVEATLRLTLGTTLFKLSDFADAEKHLRRAVDLRHQAFGAEDPRTLAAQAVLVDVLNAGSGRYSQSLPLALQTWQVRSRMLGAEHGDTIESLDNYAAALQWSGRLDDAIPLFRRCLRSRRRVLRAGHPDTLVSMNNLAHALTNHGDFSQAIALFREAIDAYRAAGPETEFAISCGEPGELPLLGRQVGGGRRSAPRGHGAGDQATRRRITSTRIGCAGSRSESGSTRVK